MTWSVVLGQGISASSTVWSGTDLPFGGISTIGSASLSKIYTTVGTKTINATTTGTLNGSLYTTTCSSTVKLDQGTNKEI